jgi:ribose-phosphate pyrophosphokinase
VEYVRRNFEKNNLIVASPDFGGIKRSRVFANHLSTELVNIDKHRDLSTGDVTAVQLQGGDVSGKTVLIFDDAILSGGTTVEAAELLKENGAEEVHFMATHGLFTGDALSRIKDSEVDSVVVTNSVHHHQLPPKVKVIDVSRLFADELKNWI